MSVECIATALVSVALASAKLVSNVCKRLLSVVRMPPDRAS